MKLPVAALFTAKILLTVLPVMAAVDPVVTAAPVPKKALSEALERRFELPVKVTKVTRMRSEIDTTPTNSDYNVTMKIDDYHKAVCRLSLVGDKQLAMIKNCTSKTAVVDADSIMPFSELDIDQNTASP